MGVKNKFEQLQKIVGGFRSDAAPTTADGDPVAFRFNSSSEVLVSVGSATGTVTVQGGTDHDAVEGGEAPVLVGYNARDTLATAVAEGDRVRGTADVYGRQYVHSASHDTLSVTDNVTVGNGPETQYQSETLADITNAAAGPAYYYIDMSGFSKLGLQFEISGGTGTLTLEGTIQDDGTAAASCTYQDIGSSTFGAASWTADAMLIDDVGKCGLYHFVRVKVVGDGAVDIIIYYKKMY